jgi:MFS transporter, DHA1 family, tetracycline resistance protein
MTETPPNSGASDWRSARMTVFLVVCIDLLGFGIVLPLLPVYVKDLLEPAGISRQLHGPVIGALMSVYSLMQFVFAPMWGRVSDRVGRRPILILGLTGSVVFYGLFGYASSIGRSAPELALWLLFASRTGAGIAGATISTAQAVIADCTPKETRARGMALIGAAFGIGFTFGPVLAALIMLFVPDRIELAGYVSSGLSFVALVVAITRMPETRRPDSLAPRRNWIDVRGLWSTLQTPTVGVLVLIFFLATFGFAGFEGTLALLNRDLGYTEKANYWIFAYVGFVLVIAQGFYRGMAKKYHELKMMRLGIGLMFIGLVGLAAVALAVDTSLRTPTFFISLAIGVVGWGFMQPSIPSLISKRTDPNRQGEVLGVNQSFSALARILGPAIGVILFELGTTRVLPYIASAVLLAIVMLLLTKVRPEPRAINEEVTVPSE